MVLIPMCDMQGATYALFIGNLLGIVVFVYYMIKDINKKFDKEQ